MMTAAPRPDVASPRAARIRALAAGFSTLLLSAIAVGGSPPPAGPPAACVDDCGEPPAAAAVAAMVPRASGLVLADQDAPLAGARVELVPMPSNFESGLRRLRGLGPPPPVAAAETDARGRYSLALEPGEGGMYRLLVRAQGRAPVQYFPLVLLEPVELPPVSPPPAEAVKVRVSRSGSKRLAGAWIFGQSGGSSRWGASGWRLAFRLARTDANGEASLPRLPGERLWVTAFAPGAAPVSDGVGAEGEVRLEAGERGRRGVLRVSEVVGTPVAGALVRTGDLAWPVGTTGDDGRLQLVVPPGAAPAVRVYGPDGRHGLLRWTPEGPPERRMTLPRATRLEGRLLSAEDRRPLADALVWQGADPGAWARTDAEGRFRLAIAEREGFWIQAEAAGRIPVRHRFEIVDSNRPRVPTLALERAVGIEVRVADESGSPVEGTRLSALRRAPGTRGYTRPDRADSRGLSRVDGAFPLAPLEAGRAYTLVAARPGYTTARVEFRAPPFGAPRAARPVDRAPAPEPGSIDPAGPTVIHVTLRAARGAVGRVVDLEDRPVPGAEVAARAAGTRPRPPGSRLGAGSKGSEPLADPFRGTSDTEGRFRIAELPAPEVDVRVRARGFAPTLVRGVGIPERVAGDARGETKLGDIDLGTIVLAPGGRIEGRVLDGEGRGIAGAAIHALPHQVYPDLRVESRLARRTPEATSDGEGRFVLDELPISKPVDLLVAARGFLRGEARGVRAPPPEPVTVVLEPSAGVHGWVLDVDEKPIAEAEIFLESRRMLESSEVEIQVGLPESFLTASDETGFFEITGVRPGPAVVQASAPGVVTLETLHLQVPEAGVSKELRLRLERGAVVEGVVESSDGEPLPGVRIAIGEASASSDADGVYRVEGVASGPARAEAYHAKYELQRQELEVTAGRNVLDWTLPAGSRVAGRVVDGSGEPLAGSRVFLDRRQRGYRQQRQSTTADGRFDFHPVAEGTFDLWAELPGYAPAGLPAPLTVAGEDLEELELRLEPGATLRGQVLGLDFDQLSEVEVVTYRSEEERAWRAKLDYQGFYEAVDLPAGDYVVRAELRTGHRQVEARVTLSPPEEVRRDLRFDSRLTLRGRVSLDEQPLAGARISVRGRDSAAERLVATDYRGEFRLEDLEPGRYAFGLQHPVEWLVYNEILDLSADRELVLRLERSQVGGEVLEEGTGSPVVGAQVAFSRLDSSDRVVEGMISTGTDSSGSFYLPRVSPGRYQLRVRKAGFEPHVSLAEVPAGSDLEGLRVVLDPTPGLELDVRLASGAWPPWVRYEVRDASGQPVETANARTDARGRAHLASVPAGDWQVWIGAPGTATARLRARVPAEEPVSVVLAPAGRLEVRIPALVSSNLLAHLTLSDATGSPFTAFDGAGTLRSRWQLVGGKTRVERLPAGTWTLRAEAVDGRRFQGTVTTFGEAVASVSVE